MPEGEALPVLVSLRGPHAEPAVRFLEGVLGWQVVDPATAALVPPVLHLLDVEAVRGRPPVQDPTALGAGGSGATPAGGARVGDAPAGHASAGNGPGGRGPGGGAPGAQEPVGAGQDRGAAGVGPPAVLLVGEGADPAEAARAALRTGAMAALRWPAERDRLPGIARRAAARDTAGSTEVAGITVGGAAGGVGTTTVALALAGLAAWWGDPTLVITHGAAPAPTGPPREAADLAGAGTWETAAPAPGCPRLRLVRTAGPTPGAAVDPGAARLVVRDVGVDPDADVLVLRRDAAGLAALSRTGCAVAVLVDAGVAPLRAVRSAAGRRRLAVVPWSARVARAGLAGRVPSGLPGRWLAALRPALAGDRLRRARPRPGTAPSARR